MKMESYYINLYKLNKNNLQTGTNTFLLSTECVQTAFKKLFSLKIL